MVAGDEKT
jgi:alpha-methylacyl-CoA racemase